MVIYEPACADVGRALQSMNIPEGYFVALRMRAAFGANLGVMTVKSELAAGNPNRVEFWISEDKGFSELLELSISIYRDEDGGVAAEFGLYKLPAELQGKGYAKAFVQAFADFALRNDFSYLKAQAGLEVGGYAWSRFGAVPIDPASVRTELESRVNRLASDGKIEEFSRQRFMEHILNSHDNDLMIGLFETGSLPEVKLLLLGYQSSQFDKTPLLPINWAAIWPLKDAEYREKIRKRLKL